MATKRKMYGGIYTEVKMVVLQDGCKQLKQTCCCCKAPGESRKDCMIASCNKTPCRCYCHSRKI